MHNLEFQRTQTLCAPSMHFHAEYCTCNNTVLQLLEFCTVRTSCIVSHSQRLSVAFMCKPVSGGHNNTPTNLWAQGAITITGSCGVLTEKHRSSTQSNQCSLISIDTIFRLHLHDNASAKNEDFAFIFCRRF